MEREGSRQILEKYYQISRKSVAWEPSCSMRTETDGQIDGQTKLRVALRKFAKTPKMPRVLRDAKGSYRVRYVSNISYRVTVLEENERVTTSLSLRLKKKTMLSECWQNWRLYGVYMLHFLCFLLQ